MNRLTSIAPVVLLTCCSPTQNLSHYRGALELRLTPQPEPEGTKLLLQPLDLGGCTSWDDEEPIASAVCEVRLSADAQSTLNGRLMHAIGPDTHSVSKFEIMLTPRDEEDGEVEVEISDSSARLRMHAPDALAGRALEPRPLTRPLKMGEEAIFDWSHPTDDLSKSVYPGFLEVLEASSIGSTEGEEITPTLHGSEIHYAISGPIESTSQAKLYAQAAGLVHFDACDAVACTLFSRTASTSFSFEVEP
jgi:hypothetical protein